MTTRFTCEACSTLSSALAMRDEDGKMICYACLLSTSALSDKQRQHYERKVKRQQIAAKNFKHSVQDNAPVVKVE